MKKDRLDELLGRAFSRTDEVRDVSGEGLKRFRSRISGAGEVTLLDAILSKALAPTDEQVPYAPADAGLRRLRERLAQRPVRRRAPFFKPALAFAAVAVIIAALLLVQPFALVGPGGKPSGADSSPFEGSFKSRNDIIAQFPGEMTQPATSKTTLEPTTAIGSRENLRADALDAFSKEARGESIARRISSNRRVILASLSGRGSHVESETGEDNAEKALSSNPSNQELLLNEKLDRAAEGF
jgi:hypothetical protein